MYSCPDDMSGRGGAIREWPFVGRVMFMAVSRVVVGSSPWLLPGRHVVHRGGGVTHTKGLALWNFAISLGSD